MVFTKMMALIFMMIGTGWVASAEPSRVAGTPGPHDLVFPRPAISWDEAIPLGNGLLGALVWEKEGNLRLSLDRADLWDLRPMPGLQGPQFRFAWVVEQWRKGNYRAVQERFDEPYEREAAPTRIPAGALEFPLRILGEVTEVRLYLTEALCEVRGSGGARLLTFVHATEPAGWFRLDGVAGDVPFCLVPPPYGSPAGGGSVDSVSGQDLRRLGYPAGRVLEKPGTLSYEQEGWGGFRYRIHVRWQRQGRSIEGAWSISSAFPGGPRQRPAEEQTRLALDRGMASAWLTHAGWWRRFWSRSSLHLPDSVLERQWYREMYKFGAAARPGAPPVSLQAVWTADNGRIPPWKGDYHHDLNTQLSYWPAYRGNQPELAAGFTDWLWRCRPAFRRYTRRYFGTGGLNVPGVSTLAGEPMGGWIQYSFGPTVSAWLGQHFYLQWRYSGDREFLRRRAYPWVRDTARFLQELSVRSPGGLRRLPLSSSPEIHDNSAGAWFAQTTNFDLALIRFTLAAAAEMARELGKNGEARDWQRLLAEWPELASAPGTGLLVAPGVPLPGSHRHFSHLMAIHPLGLLDVNRTPAERTLVMDSLENLEKLGPAQWCGYSWSWLGNLWARAGQGERAADALRIFATCFCLPNSFHANGDQSGTGKSSYTYRPFTLEGNFACAAGILEMLLQSQGGELRLFPAIPADWQDVSFAQLRAEGAVLVSATRQAGRVVEVTLVADRPDRAGERTASPEDIDGGPEKSGRLSPPPERTGETMVRQRSPAPEPLRKVRLHNPFTGPFLFTGPGSCQPDGDWLILRLPPGQSVRLISK